METSIEGSVVGLLEIFAEIRILLCLLNKIYSITGALKFDKTRKDKTKTKSFFKYSMWKNRFTAVTTSFWKKSQIS
jgi:hypothetical protein